ncbi:membrane-bound lytic murein transglycosylase D [Dyadobacter jejuensis]|uniref:Membrane-bound lytic murein transglycosylase D n=2 Tax=Dyadobacter jejuensis TaxID=1082580 RepID=A0A316API4_9BACT|nr:membrane-bound lytic murein transglycosylase D [Dyadobacter jejuensis]
MWCVDVVAEIPQHVEVDDQDTLGIAAVADEIALEAMPEIEEIGTQPSIDSELLKERFSKLEKSIPLRYHEASHEFVEFFIYKRSSFTRSMMERKALFFPMFEKLLKEHGLPEELKYLSMIESGLNPRIISRAKAGGLWQFMPATGREFGLKQDGYVDERFDPVKSTEAACKYLKQLYRIFGDWEMALASYNTGPGNVKRAMRRSGGTTFWTIYNSLPRETRSYVPQFVAINYMMNYGNDHGVFPENLEFVIPSDTIQLNGAIDLVAFCRHSGVDLEVLNKLNPQLVKTSLPASTRNFILKVPSMHYTYLKNNRVAIMDSCSGKMGATDGMIAQVGSVDVLSTRQTTDAQGNTYQTITKLITQKSTHRVRRGETLSVIARRYGVGVSELKKWNHMRGSTIRTGQALVYHRQVKEVEKVKVVAAAENKAVKTEPVAAVDEPTVEVATVAETTTTTKLVNKKLTHLVRSGENLGSISTKYNVSVSDLKKWNKLRRSLILKGQKLIVYTQVREQVAATKVEKEGAKAANRSQQYYTVQRGDTLWTISQRYGLQVEILKKTNNIEGNAIKPGQKLLISG